MLPLRVGVSSRIARPIRTRRRRLSRPATARAAPTAGSCRSTACSSTTCRSAGRLPTRSVPASGSSSGPRSTWASSVVNCRRASSSCQREMNISVALLRTRRCASSKPGTVLRPRRRSRRKRRIAPGSDHQLPKVILVTTQIGSPGEVGAAVALPPRRSQGQDDRDRDESEERVRREPHRPGCSQEAQPGRRGAG